MARKRMKMIRWDSVLAILLWMSILGSFAPVNAQDAASSPAAVQDAARQEPADIEVFVREGCPHCEKAEEFLKALALEQPWLRIVVRDVHRDPEALGRLKQIAEATGVNVSVPTFYVHGQTIVGYADQATTGKLIRNALTQAPPEQQRLPDSAESCEAEEAALSCGPESVSPLPEPELTFLGQRITLKQFGLPLFTLVMGLMDGFNPCSMWVLVLMISLLAPMQDRMRMFAVAGTFIAVEGIAYFVFMAAWLNLFLIIGLSRLSQIIIAGIAILAGAINLKDFWAYGWGVSLSIPESAKPGIYARIRAILQAESLRGAMIGAVVLAVLVQIVEFLCTSGFPALYTRILTMQELGGASYYGYLLLYNLAYMLDDAIVLGIGIITLSQRRLREKEGRWLKLISGLVMVGLGLYLLVSVP
ncbi:glutaredoxin family protein [Methylobacter sp. YRD-M1]|uniref:glutaredoxin family protein n=1 Tax=Methylobacter sp. YRD-M1 TaxID=2911520 RepID=UPI00227CB9F3|nr:glutaredoxin family protein [Methylobacter sp. YRD-M1]WAK01113.1 glutaredoxin family protein [Methylobacter sp. YRD-M1]